MTLEQLVVYSGVVLCIWLALVLALMTVGHRHREVLDLGGPVSQRSARPTIRPARPHRLRHAFGHR